MEFWFTDSWQVSATALIKSALDAIHRDLSNNGGSGNRVWTEQVLRALIPIAQGAPVGAAERIVCALKNPPQGLGCTGEWLYDFSSWIETIKVGGSTGFRGLPLIAESEWGYWRDIWDDFDKLGQARAGLKVLVFENHARDTPPDWEDRLKSRLESFEPKGDGEAWLLAAWSNSGFDFRTWPHSRK